ncbi:MAG: tRNA epoxyqueuosine(34) reductase QueG [Verrucomicrobia bacterium]|nr:tRNA epoxyqueuosine(34) reductase QueG [Verrucomicrobiota bacterium]
MPPAPRRARVVVKARLQQRARELGFDACRVTTAAAPADADHFHAWLADGRHGEMTWLARNADKRTDPQRVLPGARSIVCVAAAYSADRAESVVSGQWSVANNDAARPPRTTDHGPRTTDHGQPTTGVVARYARFTDYHDVLAEKLKQLSNFISTLAPESRSLWYVDTGPLLERDLAQRAGLGFIGKHTNLISRGLGNWFFLAEILTTAELEPDAPEKNRCGTCARCLAACPTQCITAPFQLDARRCISYLTIELKGSIPVELRPLIGNRIYGCDDCLAVCPWNKFAREGALMKPHARAEFLTPDLLELLALDNAGFKKKFAGTPMLRTKRRGLLRNVCVALGNVGDAHALPALLKATSDAEPLVAEHARWAMEQIEAREKAASART